MSKSNARDLFSQHIRLAYWIARKWTRGINACQGVFLTTDELCELTQDAVCRSWDRFSRRCESGLPSDEEMAKDWLCQCTLYAARDTVRRKSAFGTESSPSQIRGDIYQRVRLFVWVCSPLTPVGRSQKRKHSPRPRAYLAPANPNTQQPESEPAH
jgi:hypothetical protein